LGGSPVGPNAALGPTNRTKIRSRWRSLRFSPYPLTEPLFGRSKDRKEEGKEGKDGRKERREK